MKLKTKIGPVQQRSLAAPVQRQAADAPAPQHRQAGVGVEPTQHRLTIINPKKRLTVSTVDAPVGHFGLFDICTNQDLISLSFSGVDRFIQWLNFRQTSEYIVKRGFISWMRGAYSSGALTEGWLADPCADPAGVEYGVCDFTLTDFARLRRGAPVRDLTMNNLRRCINEPRWRLDGSQITSIDEWDSVVAMEAVLTDFRRMLINGNKSTTGQFDGLQRLVKTGYTNANNDPCELMDSMVVNWNSNPFGGGSGITINGVTIANTYDLISILLWIHQTIKQRIMHSPMLSARQRRVGDTILLMPSWLTRCVLDAFTCWSVCAGREFNETNLNTYESRNFRNALNGGAYGFGNITLDGDVIPLMGYDYGTATGGVAKLASLTRVGTTATVTTVQAHGLTSGQTVTIGGATGTEYNGSFVVSVTGATTFTYTVSGSPTSPDPSTSILVTIPMAADIFYLTGSIGDQRLIEIEGLNMANASDMIGYNKFQTLDMGRFLTWTESDHTCVQRFLEMRPRLLAWAPWTSARIQGVNCTTPVAPFMMDPNSLAFPAKTMTAVS